jgi:8-oxo-dGTP diphosphatase
MENFWAGGFLYNPKNKAVLLHKRDSKTKFNPNMWAFFGGLNNPLETPTACFIREIKEELGIEIKPGDAILLNDYFNEEFQAHRFVFYVINEMDKSRFVLGEGADLEWISLDQLNKFDLTEKTLKDLKFFIEKLLK